MDKRKQKTLNEYEIRGSYHADMKISNNWLPTYLRRNYVTTEFFQKYVDKNLTVFELGCGEGLMIKQLRSQGYENIFGMDLYATFVDCDKMIKADCLEVPVKSESIDVLICLDLVEHIPLNFQDSFVNEISRILKPGGVAIFSFPNMAHLSSRLKFLFKGIPWRNKLDKHPGELTLWERTEVFKSTGLLLQDTAGFHLTVSNNPNLRGFLGKVINNLMFWHNNPSSLCLSVMAVFSKGSNNSLNIDFASKSPLKQILKTYK